MTEFDQKIKDSLDKLRPTVQADGGDMEFISFDEATGVVTLRLIGMCNGCAMAMMSIKEGVEPQLKLDVPQVKSVEALEDEEEPVLS
jgi:Fe-S cluster biogenesis protein NfuA